MSASPFMLESLLTMEGRAAELDGIARSMNPYATGTQAHAFWLAGWDGARMEAAVAGTLER